MNMKDLITQALDTALYFLNKQTPLVKEEVKSISIVGVKPMDLMNFMKENNIPSDAYFNGRDNGYDAWDDICLSWNIEVPTTYDERLDYRKKRFTSIAFKLVYDTLINAGYKRVGFCSSLLKEFEDTTVYSMYIDNDFDRLVKYYSLYFVKES